MAQVKTERIYDPTLSAISIIISPMAQVKAGRILNSALRVSFYLDILDIFCMSIAVNILKEISKNFLLQYI